MWKSGEDTLGRPAFLSQLCPICCLIQLGEGPSLTPACTCDVNLEPCHSTWRCDWVKRVSVLSKSCFSPPRAAEFDGSRTFFLISERALAPPPPGMDFSGKGQMVNILDFAGDPSHSSSALWLLRQQSQQSLNKWLWLYSSKTLLMGTEICISDSFEYFSTI